MNNRLKSFMRLDGQGKIVPGSLISREKMPKSGKWIELIADNKCCLITSTTTSTTSTTSTTTSSTTTSTTSTTTTSYFTPLSDVNIGFPTAMYRNYEGEEMLSTGDEPANSRLDWTVGTPIYFKSYDSGTKKLTLTNVPYIERMVDTPSDWAVADMVSTNDISGSAARINTVTYLPDSGGEKGICEFILTTDVGTAYNAFTTSSKFIIFSPKSNLVMGSTPVTTRNQSGFTEKYYSPIALHRRDDGTWNVVIRGYRGGSNTPIFVYRSYIASDPMGTWTAETGTNLFTDASSHFTNFKELYLFKAFIDVDGKLTITGNYWTTGNVYVPCYLKMDKDLSNVTYHLVSFSGIDLSSTTRWPTDNIEYNPHTSKYYLTTTPDSVYNSRRYILSSSTLNGTFTVDEMIISGTDRNELTPHVQKPSYTSNLATMAPNCIGGEIVVTSIGEGITKSGNYANHVVNMMRKGNDGWEWITTPVATAYHIFGKAGSPYIWGTGFSWAWDHMGLGNFCCDGITSDGKLYYVFEYCAGTDTYQSVIGYFDASKLIIPSDTIIFTTPSSFTVSDDTKAIGLVQAKVNNSSIVNNHVKYSIVGGADADKVTIRTFVGMLNFDMSPLPAFESPGDANGDNVYEIIVRASTFDGAHHTDQSISITVIE